MARQQQGTRGTGPAAGFFGGIETGRENTQIRAESELRAQEKLSAHMLASQKREDTVLAGVRSEIMEIQTAMPSATPETIGGLQDRKNYLIKTVAPEMLPDEWFARGGEGYTPSDETGVGAGASVGSLVPTEFELGDPKAGAERLKKGGMRRVTKGEMRDYNMAQDGRITTDMGSYKRGTKVYKVMGYGSQIAMNQDMFMKQGYGTAVDILSKNGTQSVTDGMQDDALWQKVKAGMYRDADASGIDPDVAKKLVNRFEQGRTDRLAGVKSQLDIESKIIATVTKEIDGWFGIERSITGEILRFTKGSQPLFLSLKKRLYDEVSQGATSPAAIAAGLHIAAESWAMEHTGQKDIFAPVALRSTGADRKALKSHPVYAQDFENLNKNAYYDDINDLMIVANPEGGTAYVLYGEAEIVDATRMALNAQTAFNLAESLVGLEQTGQALMKVESRPTKAEKAKAKRTEHATKVFESTGGLIEQGIGGVQQYDEFGEPISTGELAKKSIMDLLLGGG